METTESLRRKVADSHGAERAWAYRNLALVERGYYSSDELIDLATIDGFTILDPSAAIRRGTRIARGAVINDRTSIDGDEVSIGPGTVLDGAMIKGSRIRIGADNRIGGIVEISNVSIGNHNSITGLLGRNAGELRIGSGNFITGVKIESVSDGLIEVGDHNELWAGLNLNVPFANGSIRIGTRNSLGRDGGGVISSSYRFGRKWSGHVVIGTAVETTRGAEVLGFSMLGFHPDALSSSLNMERNELRQVFVDGDLHRVSAVFARLTEVMPVPVAVDAPTANVALFGTVKVKRALLMCGVTVRDDTRIQSAYVRDVLIPERCTIAYTSIEPESGKVMRIPTQDCKIVQQQLTTEPDWHALQVTVQADDYPKSDGLFYNDLSWDTRET